jgi:dihydroorotate dehydrogenase (NAD+) catalytic subunit
MALHICLCVQLQTSQHLTTHRRRKHIMIKLSNGVSFEHIVASGALAFKGKGWFWEWILYMLGFLKPELCPVVLKTVTFLSRKGNLSWWHPWTCVKLIRGGAVNKVGLTNKGFDWFCRKVLPKIDFQKYPVVVSILGGKHELVAMAEILNGYDVVAIEVNYSCPNEGTKLKGAAAVVDSVKAVAEISRHPVIVKVSVDQDYLAIAKGLKGIAQAISINSIPWTKVFPDKTTPFHRLEKRVGGGGGGVSGKPAQKLNWKAVRELAEQSCLPVIAPSIMEYDDMDLVREMGASAVSFGTIHLPTWPMWNPLNWASLFTNPLKPTRFIEREQQEQ